MVGIKGAGLAALAQILASHGVSVCGSDTQEVFFTDELLKKQGIRLESFGVSHAVEPDGVIYSTSYTQDNPDIRFAIQQGIPLLSYPEAVSVLFNQAYGIAVCGSHGKTTITGLLSYVCASIGLDPTALIGSAIQKEHINVYTGSSPYWILEADEYQNKFEYYSPRAIILSSIDYDHPDFFQSREEYEHTFRTFIEKPSCELVVACADDVGVRSVLGSSHVSSVRTYGFHESSDYHICDLREDAHGFCFSVKNKDRILGPFSLSLIGQHNVANATGVIALLDTLQLGSMDRIITAMKAFPGTVRRFEIRGMHGKTMIVDDYAHHPTEIQATLRAARNRYPGKKIWCCFGPHTFSRTEKFFDEFVKSFRDADHVLVLDIYSSVREKKGTIHAKDLANAIQKASGNATYTGSIENTIAFLRDTLHDIDILITMGAGDVWRVGEGILSSSPKINS